MRRILFAGVVALSALMAGPGLAQTGTTGGTQALAGVNSTATTYQNNGLTIGAGTRINGGIHGVTIGDNTATTHVRTDAYSRVNSDALIDTTGHGRQALAAAIPGARVRTGADIRGLHDDGSRSTAHGRSIHHKTKRHHHD